MKPHSLPALLVAAALSALASCTSPSAPSGTASRGRPGSVVDEQIMEIGGRQFRQQRIVTTTDPYESRIVVTPVN